MSVQAPTLQSLARPSGTFAMVAMDQRESLRALLHEATQDVVGDDSLVAFKLAVARHLSSYASGFLIDRMYGYRELVDSHRLPPDCGLILAADTLTHGADHAIIDTEIDTEVRPSAARADGVVALKLLVVWRNDADRERRLEMAGTFVKTCADAGLLSIIEAVVQPSGQEQSDWDRDSEIVNAAVALNDVSPSLYKAQVPAYGRGSVAELARACEKISAVVDRPWVVLSNGVAPSDFPAAVEAACRGGASGTLAGRAVWTPAVGATNLDGALSGPCAARLAAIGEVIDRYGRPWQDMP